MINWTPLTAIGDLPRGPGSFLDTGSGLLRATPRVGAFWSGRNAAALPWEIGESYGQIEARARAVAGAYRRPLDAPDAGAGGATVLGWQQVGERAALIGRAAYDNVRVDPGTNTIAFNPYGSTPFVITDSTSTPQRSMHARLEGAAGWRLGGWGIGIALGYDAEDRSTTAARVPRLAHAACPAVSLGVIHDLAGGALRLGAYGRLTHSSATLQMVASPGSSLITRLNGLAPPTIIPIAPDQNAVFYRRAESRAHAAGLTAAGLAGSWTWALSGEGGLMDESSWSRREPDPPRDTWEAQTLSFDGALQRGFDGDGMLLILKSRWTGLRGEARLADVDSVIFAASETAAWIHAELHWIPTDSRWIALAAIAMGYHSHDRGERIANSLRTDIQSLTTEVRGEVAHRLTRRTRLAASYTLSSYNPSGSIPLPVHYPASIRPLIGAEVAFHSTPALGHAGMIAAQWQASSTTALTLTGTWRQTAPRPAGVNLEFTPDGKRSQWFIAAGAAIR